MSEPEKTTNPSSFAGDVFKLVSGTTVAQGITVLATPLITRLYSPDALGTTSVFNSIASILHVIACLRYERAIMLPEQDRDAANLLAISLCAVLFVSTASWLLIWAVGTPLIRLLNAPDLRSYLWLLPPSVLAVGGFLAFNYWNTRTKHFGRLSIARVTQSVAMNSSRLGIGLLGQAGAGGLIGGQVLGYCFVTATLGKLIWQEDRDLVRRSISWQKVKTWFIRHRKFPLYTTWSALLNNISWQLPTFILSAFFSQAIVGYYDLGTQVLRIPMAFIGSSIAQVFFQRAAEAKGTETLTAVVENTFRYLVVLGLFPLLLLTIVGRDLFVIVFGESWAEAGVYAQILSVWTFFWFISSPLSTLYNILEKQRFDLILNIVILVTRLISLLVGSLLNNARLALLLFSLSGILVYGYLSLVIMSASGVAWRWMFQTLAVSFARFIPAGGLLLLLKAFNVPSWIQLGCTGIILSFYFLFIIRSDLQIRQLLHRIRSKKLDSLR